MAGERVDDRAWNRRQRGLMQNVIHPVEGGTEPIEVGDIYLAHLDPAGHFHEVFAFAGE